MVAAKCTDAEFVELFEAHGAAETARRIGGQVRSVAERRRRLEEKLKRRIDGPAKPQSPPAIKDHPHRIMLDIPTGTVLVGGDAHYWPGEPSTAHRALVRFAKELKPNAIVIQGDSFDGARISRHPPIGWAETPTVQEELETVQERHHEIALAGPRGCRKVWSLGNHDARFETKIATVAPEFAKVHGTSLRDHFPVWEPCWGCWINDNPKGVVIKHRFKGGLHAAFNNALWAGRSMVTGHLHSAKAYPIADYNGLRFGVETGCLADVYGPQFTDYTEDNPRNWQSAFAVLTFKDGMMLQPEFVMVWDSETVQFRGELIRV